MNKSESERLAAFETCLGEIVSGRETVESSLSHYPGLADSLRPDLQAALWLHHEGAAVQPSPAFLSASRRRIVASIREESFKRHHELRLEKLNLLRRNRTLRFSLVVLLLAMLLANSSGIASAARVSFPGDVLYPVKVVSEEIQLAYTLTPVGDARLHARFAQRRLAELAAVILEGRYNQIAPVAASFEVEVEQAAVLIVEIQATDPGQFLELSERMQVGVFDQVQVLELLKTTLPENLWAPLDRVLEAAVNAQVLLKAD